MDGPEVCRALGITKRTLQSYRDRRRLAYTNVGGKFLYKESDLAAFLQSKTVGKEV